MPEIIRDGSIAGQIPQIPEFRVVSATVFADRAERLLELARGHALEEYLRFVAALAQAQNQVLDAFPGVPLPDPETLQHCRLHGVPPLSVDGHRRDPAWRRGLHRLLDALNRDAIPPQARAVVERLHAAPEEAIEKSAASLLAGAYGEVDPGQAPFVAAALQVYWVSMAQRLGMEGFGRDVRYGLCALCGSHPVSSIVRVGGAQQGLRYIVCSLCASERHVVRVKCTACASTAGIAYFGIEGAKESVKAEACDACKTYLKVLYLEKDTRLDPSADDLATLALDMLVDAQGYNRIGANLLFVPGRPE